METQALTTIVDSSDLELLIIGWLDAKFRISKSTRTRDTYKDMIYRFRAELQRVGLDLDRKQNNEVAAIALVAQAFAGLSARGKEVSTSTYNLRLSIISSFYDYAVKKSALEKNPLDSVERGKVEPYAHARALEPQRIEEALDSIDRTTTQGKRDYAILAILLQTGRRLNEVVSLQLKNLQYLDGMITVEFEHCKGGKVMYDTLPKTTSYALLDWLKSHYGQDIAIGMRGDNRPVWVVLIKNESIYGQSLGAQTVANICEKYLGTSRVHTTRHSWAKTMEDVGAKTSDIQHRLGHASLATTGKYLQSLKSADNPHADKLAAKMGIK